MDVIILLAHGCSVEWMRSGWTLYGLPMDAREQAGNYQVLYAPVSSFKPTRVSIMNSRVSCKASLKDSDLGITFRGPVRLPLQLPRRAPV